MGFDLWGQGRDGLIGDAPEFTDKEALLAVGAGLLDPRRRDAIIFGAGVRGGKEAVGGAWDLLNLFNDNQPINILLRGGRLSDDLYAIGDGIANGAQGLSGKYDYGSTAGQGEALVDLLKWAGSGIFNAVKGDAIDAGTVILNGDGSVFTDFRAGYEADVVGGFVFDLALTAVTFGAGGALQARKLAYLDDFMGPLGKSSGNSLDDFISMNEVSTAIGGDVSTLNNFKRATLTDKGHNVIVHGDGQWAGLA